MSLSDHARAARITSQAFKDAAEIDMADGLHDSATVGLAIASGYLLASERMELAMQEDARQMAAGHACSIDHSTLKQPACPLCKAPRIVK